MIRINTAKKEELTTLPGIGPSKADRILEFLEAGGTINDVDELAEVIQLGANYRDALVAKADFTIDGNATPSFKIPGDARVSVIPIAPADPFVPVRPLPLPIFEPFQFMVRFVSIAGGQDLPDLTGYKLLVGYRVRNVLASGKAVARDHSKTLNLGADPSVVVSIPKQFVRASYLEGTFSLLVTDPRGEAVYRSSFDVEPDDEVVIGLDVVEAQTLDLKLVKRQGASYEGYTLNVKSRVNRGTSGVDNRAKTFDIGTGSEFQLQFDQFGQIVDVHIEVLSDADVRIHDESYMWDELEPIDGDATAKALAVELPRPASIDFTTLLVVDSEALDNPYLDHRLIIGFDVLDAESRDFLNRIERNVLISADGRAEVKLDHYGHVDSIDLEVHAPAGEIIGRRAIGAEEWTADGEIRIEVPPRRLAGIDGFETLPERPKKMAGRVIDVKGDKKFEGAQVIVSAATVDEPDDGDFAPLLVAETETDGYFLVDMPVGPYTGAKAQIGVPRFGNSPPDVHEVVIPLETDSILTMVDGSLVRRDAQFFPGRLILVVDTESGANDEECDCDDCGDSFHKHKAVVDEFSFYTVVRTTEPNIQGYTLEEDGEMTVQNVLDIVPLEDDETGARAMISNDLRLQTVRRSVLMKYVNDRKGLTLTTLRKALNESNAQKLREEIRPSRDQRALGRHTLDLDHPIDWDEDPTIYQATTLVHGHLIQYKQEYKDNGNGTGSVLLSQPLAPGQVKQIVVFDWERRESAGRRESLDYQESLYNSLSRDRDVNEIVTGVLTENTRGGSTARTSSFGGGFGIGAIVPPVGGLLGVAGGSSKASSTAWQNSSRNTAVRDLQQIRDRTIQSANATRSLRSTVVTSATQGERFSAETEVIANYNHCHSLTMQYYEVLRHMQVETRISSVQECLFVPLIMTTFDHQKILRWREPLERFVPSRQLQRGFGAIERIEQDYEGSDLPEGMYAEEEIDQWSGDIYLKIEIPNPADLAAFENREEARTALAFLGLWGISVDRLVDQIFEREQARRNEYFEQFVAPDIAAAIVDRLRFHAVTRQDGRDVSTELDFDTTLVSRFQNGGTHYVSIREAASQDPLTRLAVEAITIQVDAETQLNDGQSIEDFLPANTRIIVTSGQMRYRTKYNAGTVFRASRINNDLVGYGGVADNDLVRIPTPLSRAELRNPRNEDLELANNLQNHLNDNLEDYHKTIWMSMSPERRFMFLDGIQVTDYSEVDEYPRGVVRSVASVVENRVIGIVGNSLVMPVAPGFRLDPNTRGQEVDLISLYQPLTPVEPINITIPTKGVFAEAVMGRCNSCEKIENDRFWKWEEHPIPFTPTSISEVSTDSRRSDPLSTTPSELPNPVVNIQNAPALPDPAGLAAAASLLEAARFEDITGLTQNQRNAIDALKSSLSTAQAFGTKAADMAALGAQLEAIKDARQNNLVDPEKAQELSENALENFNAGNATRLTEGLADLKKVDEMERAGSISAETGKAIKDAIVGKVRNDAEGKPEGGVAQIMDRASSLVESGAVSSLEAKASDTDGSSAQVSLASTTTSQIPVSDPADFASLHRSARNLRITLAPAGVKLRKAWDDLTAAEKQRFEDGITNMRNSPNANGDPVTVDDNRYEDFVAMHELVMQPPNMVNWAVHWTRIPANQRPAISNFLPWHRVYMAKFEDELIAAGGIPLPYWDWYRVKAVPAELDAADLARWNVTRAPSPPIPPPSAGDVERPWRRVINTQDWNQFHQDWEWVHNEIHIHVGGDMGTAASPRDPIFWLHHGFVDKIWADLQHITNNSVQPSNLLTVLEPSAELGGVTVGQTIDHLNRFNYQYAEPFRALVTGSTSPGGVIV